MNKTKRPSQTNPILDFQSFEIAAANQKCTQHEKQALAPQRKDGLSDSSLANHPNISMDRFTAWLFSGDLAPLKEGGPSSPSGIERNQGRETGSSAVDDVQMQGANFPRIYSNPSIFSEEYRPGDFPTASSDLNSTTSPTVSAAVGHGQMHEISDIQWMLAV